MRNLIVILAVVIAGGAIFASYQYSKKSYKAGDDLTRERYARMTAEEALEQAQNKIESITSELTRTTRKADGLEKKLTQVDAINKDLKGKLDVAQGQLVDLQAKVISIKSAVQEQSQAVSTTPVPAEGSGT